MKNITKLLKILKSNILVCCLMFVITATAQVGIGTTSPASGALLDLSDAHRGLLVPRVSINVLGTAAPVTAPTTGLLVGTTFGGTGVGFHYWDGTQWVPIGGGATSNDWTLAGNAITGTEFLGTTNTNDLDIRTDNVDRMRVQANGQVSVNFAGAANPGDQLSSVGTFAVSGYSGGTGIGVYGQNIGGGDAVAGINNSTGTAINGLNIGSGIGVYAENFFGNNYSVYALDGFYSVYGDNNIGGDALRGDTDSTISNGVWGTNPNATGTAVIGGANGLSIYRTGGSGIAGSGNQVGVFGYAGLGAIATANQGNAAGIFDLDTDANPTTIGNNGTKASAVLAGFDNVQPFGTTNTRNSYFGGYFDAGYRSTAPAVSPTYAYVGMRYRTGANGTSAGTTTDYKIIGTGSVSTLIKDKNNIPRILFSPEAPEILFEDYGIGKLVNGIAHINIDPLLKDAIYVDDNYPLKVFIQLEGDCNGVYVTNKSSNGFTVRELQSGQSNVPFSWHIVANRADTKVASGRLVSKHVGLRFPVGPGPLKSNELASRKENVDLSNIPTNQKVKSKELTVGNNDKKDPSKKIEFKK